jgi:hypothetical protein
MNKFSMRARIELSAGLVAILGAVTGILAHSTLIFAGAALAAFVALAIQLSEAKASRIAELERKEWEARKAEFQAAEIRAKDKELADLRSHITSFR